MSEKSIAEKLQIKPGRSMLLVGAPEGFTTLLSPLPAGVVLAEEQDAPVDIIQVFVKNRAVLVAELSRLKALLRPGGMIWVTYLKGSARVKTDIHRDTINAYAQTLGLTGIAIISIDQDWSALRLKQV